MNISVNRTIAKYAAIGAAAAALAVLAALLPQAPAQAQTMVEACGFRFATSAGQQNVQEGEMLDISLSRTAGATCMHTDGDKVNFTFVDTNGDALVLPASVGVFSIGTGSSTGISNFESQTDANGDQTGFTVQFDSADDTVEIRVSAVQNTVVEVRDKWTGRVVATTDGVTTDGTMLRTSQSPFIVIQDDDQVIIRLFDVTDTPAVLLDQANFLNLTEGSFRELQVRITNGLTVPATTDLRVEISGIESVEFEGVEFAIVSGVEDRQNGTFTIETGTTESTKFRIVADDTDLIRRADIDGLSAGFLNMSARVPSAPALDGRLDPLDTRVNVIDDDIPHYGFRHGNTVNITDPIMLTEGGGDRASLQVATLNSVELETDVVLTITGATPAEAARLLAITDFPQIPDLRAHTRTVNAGMTAAQVGLSFRVVEDDLYNGGTLDLVVTDAVASDSGLLDAPGAFTTETLTLIVTDNDTPVVRVVEAGVDGGEVNFRVELTDGSPRLGADLAVNFEITSGSAFASPASPGRATIAAGEESVTVTVVLESDNRVGSVLNMVTLTLPDDPSDDYEIASGGASARQAANDPDIPEFGFRNPDDTDPGTIMLDEGGMTAALEAYITNGVTIDADVRLTPILADIRNRALLAANQQSVVIPSGMSESTGTFMVEVANNNIYQGGGRFGLDVALDASAPNNIFSGAGSFLVDPLPLSVMDDDRARIQAVAAGQSGSNVRFRVQPAAGAPSIGRNLAVMIRVDAPDGLFTGTTPTTVTIMGGEEFGEVTLTAASDGAFGGPPRNAMLTVVADAGYDVAGDPAVLAVIDPDSPVVEIVGVSAVTLEREGGTHDLVVRLAAGSASPGGALAVDLEFNDPSGTLSLVGGGALPASVTIPDGQSMVTLALQIVEDAVYEGGEDQVATVRLGAAISRYAVVASAASLMLTVPDDDALTSVPPPVGELPPGVEVLPPAEPGGTPVLEVQEDSALTLTLQTNYPAGTVLAVSLGAGEESYVMLESSEVTVGADGRVSIRLLPQSVARTQDATLTLTPQGARAGLDAVVQPIRVDNEEVSAVLFGASVPQTGGAEPGAWLWLLAVAAAVLMAAGALLWRRRLFN